MTMYNCDHCEKYVHISKLGIFLKQVQIKDLKWEMYIRLCRPCMRKANIKFHMEDGYVELTNQKSSASDKEK